MHWLGEPPAGVPVSGDPLLALRDTVEALGTPRLPGLPPLTGGMVGFVSWDAVRRWERLPDSTVDELGVPELSMSLATDLAVLDPLLLHVPAQRVTLLPPVSPVVASPDRKPQLFTTMTRWRELAEELDLPLWEVAVRYEMDASGWSRARVLGRMRELAALMRRQTRAVYEEDVEVVETEFRPDFARRWLRHAETGARVTDGVTARASPAWRPCRGRWAAGRVTSTPPSAP